MKCGRPHSGGGGFGQLCTRKMPKLKNDGNARNKSSNIIMKFAIFLNISNSVQNLRLFLKRFQNADFKGCLTLVNNVCFYYNGLALSQFHSKKLSI